MTPLYYNAKLKEAGRKLRKAGILHEVLLWQQIKNKQLNGLNWLRQRVIGNYIVDFYNMSNKVVIEIDGYSHDNEKKQEDDAIRDKFFKSQGIEIIRISAKDILQNMSAVISFLKERLPKNNLSDKKK
ncbi:MAG: endonuclease domain-containing protein [Endomicrobium sp.]|jgi:very-short-patch-repair endonuclease|nr:endonuclease domain-containing protein [Endomicrobium sp.]